MTRRGKLKENVLSSKPSSPLIIRRQPVDIRGLTKRRLFRVGMLVEGLTRLAVAALLLAINCGEATGGIHGSYEAPRRISSYDGLVTREPAASEGGSRFVGVATCLVLRGGGEVQSDLSLGVFGDMGADVEEMGLPVPSLDELEAVIKMGESEWEVVNARMRETAESIDSIPPDRVKRILSGDEMLLPGIIPGFEAKLAYHFKRVNAVERMEEETVKQREAEAKDATATQARKDARQQQRMRGKNFIAKELRTSKLVRRAEQEKRWAAGPPRPVVSEKVLHRRCRARSSTVLTRFRGRAPNKSDFVPFLLIFLPQLPKSARDDKNFRVRIP